MGSLCDSTVYHSLRSPFIVDVVHAGQNSSVEFVNATIFRFDLFLNESFIQGRFVSASISFIMLWHTGYLNEVELKLGE